MTFVRTLLLALVAAGLGAYLWLVEAPRLEQEARAELLLDFEPASVEKVRLAYPDGTAIEAAKEGGKWMLTAPVAYPADGTIVENFLTTIKETKIERRLTGSEAGALATYGLEGERGTQARLEVTLAGGKPMPAVVLGTTTPVGYQAFARREGSDEVLVIPLLLQSSAKKAPDELRAKTMFEAGSEGVKKVTIDKPGEKIVLERRPNDTWAMQAPVEDEADVESVRSMLDSMSTVDAIAFFDGDKADRKAFGLEEGATKFTAERDDGSTVAFAIGKEATDQPAGSYFERASDKQVVKVPDWVATKFAPPASELREKRLLSCSAGEIRALAFYSASEEFTLMREGAGRPWRILPEIAGQVVNQRIVDNAVNSLVIAHADTVVGDAASEADLAKWGLDHPVARLEVTGTKGPCASLSGAPAPVPAQNPAAPPRPPLKQFLVKNAGRSAVLRASEHEYSRIAMKRGAFTEAAPKDGSAPAAGSAPAVPGNAPAAPGNPPAAARPPIDPEELGTIVEPGTPPAAHP